jgi:hypothetical protein
MAQAIKQSPVPATMHALAIPSDEKPSTYGIATLPTPQITKPDDVLIKVHAASVNPMDIIVADGALKMASKDTYANQCTLPSALSSPFGPFLVAGSRAIHSESTYIFHCRYNAMLYLRGRSCLLTRGGTLEQTIEVCGQQLVSPGGDQQIAALSYCEPLSPSAYYHSHSRA